MNSATPRPSLSRRGFVSALGAGSLAVALSSCAAGGGSSSGSALKFWDMQWGADASYNTDSKKIVSAFKRGSTTASYQTISWSNFNQTFATAISSKTGPAVSTGGGFQAFQFAEQGAIQYADDVLDSMKKSGLYNDFVDGTIDAMKTKNGYAAVPWNLDVVALWYRKSLLDDAGITSLPTTWDQYADAAEKLAKKGTYAFGAGNGSDNSFGYEPLFAMMINNGGGLFDTDGNLDVVNEKNIEAINFVLELQKMGAIDPGSVSYTTANYLAKWKSKTIAMGWWDALLDKNVDGTGDVLVASPLTSPSGAKGTIYYVNNVMMYTNTPSKEDSAALLTYWVSNLHKLWDANAVPEVPALKSIIESTNFKQNSQNVAIAEQWLPVAKTLAAQSVPLSAKLGQIDGGSAAFNFASTVLGGTADAKTALQKLEAGIKSSVAS